MREIAGAVCAGVGRCEGGGQACWGHGSGYGRGEGGGREEGGSGACERVDVYPWGPGRLSAVTQFS